MREEVEIRNRRRESTYALAVAVVVGRYGITGWEAQPVSPAQQPSQGARPGSAPAKRYPSIRARKRATRETGPTWG